MEAKFNLFYMLLDKINKGNANCSEKGVGGELTNSKGRCLFNSERREMSRWATKKVFVGRGTSILQIFTI